MVLLIYHQLCEKSRHLIKTTWTSNLYKELGKNNFNNDNNSEKKFVYNSGLKSLTLFHEVFIISCFTKCLLLKQFISLPILEGKVNRNTGKLTSEVLNP